MSPGRSEKVAESYLVVPGFQCHGAGRWAEIQPGNGFGNLLLGRTGESPRERLKVRIRPEKLSTGQS